MLDWFNLIMMIITVCYKVDTWSKAGGLYVISPSNWDSVTKDMYSNFHGVASNVRLSPSFFSLCVCSLLCIAQMLAHSYPVFSVLERSCDSGPRTDTEFDLVQHHPYLVQGGQVHQHHSLCDQSEDQSPFCQAIFLAAVDGAPRSACLPALVRTFSVRNVDIGLDKIHHDTSTYHPRI